MAYLSPLGYRFGLEAQDEKNVRFYEKLGFQTVQEASYPKGKITHRYMIYAKKTDEPSE